MKSLKKNSKDININSLDDARNYVVGGYKGDAIALYLESQGFEIEYVSKDFLNARKLDRERIDLWATGHLLGPYYAKENGVFNLEVAFVFKETVMSLAFNKNTDDKIISRLNRKLDKMKTKGVIGRIEAKYQ